MKPVVDGLQAEYSDRVDFRMVDFYANRDEASKMGALGHPTLVVARADGTTARILPGVPSRETIKEALDEALQ